MSELQDRLRGIAVGATVGDALGMPLEFHPPQPDYALITEMLSGPLPTGTFTDDTEMALCLAESLQFSSPLNPRDLSGRFLAWYQNRPTDIGVHTAHVLARLAAGADYKQAALQEQTSDPDSAGNGGVMRAWPLAIVRHNNSALLMAETRLQCELTHTHPDSINGTLLFNLILYQILQEPNSSPYSVIRVAIDRAIEQVPLSEDFLLAVRLAPMRMRSDLKNSGWVQHSLESALWAVQTTRSFEEALVSVINLGHDADTAGSLTGAIAGALYGLESIPKRWRQALHGEYPLRSGHLWFEQDFIQLADRLAVLDSAN